MAKQPVMIFKSHGVTGDEIDSLELTDSFENPARWEDTLRKVFAEAKSDPGLATLLEQIHLQENRAEAFARFCSSGVANAIGRFLGRFGVTHKSAICDLGCGPGHLAYALHERGFQDITAMDPNGEWYTGTGYLQSIMDRQIHIVNDLKNWRRISGRFDAIVSIATIHHWQHIPLVGIDVRRTMKPGAFWFAFSEYFANTPTEFFRAIKEHPTASRYASYEWAYPPSAYVDLIQSVGFNLIAVVPYFYRANELTGSMRDVPDDVNIETLNRTVDENLVALGGTVDAFWSEVDHFRRHAHGHRIYTEPQVLVFQRVAP